MKILELTGNADELFQDNKEKHAKSVSVISLGNDDEPCDLDITLTSFSTNNYTDHKTIDKLLGHKIKFTLEVVD